LEGVRAIDGVGAEIGCARGEPVGSRQDRQASVSAIQVTEQDLAQFEMAVAIACVRMSDKRLERQGPTTVDRAAYTLPSYFSTTDGSLAISFDRSWYPFLCNTSESNGGPQRWYIPKVSRLIATIARALQSPMQRATRYVPGGRVLLDAAGGRRQPEGHGEIPVLQWCLPRPSWLLPTR
jgi:hypothetical protein